MDNAQLIGYVTNAESTMALPVWRASEDGETFVKDHEGKEFDDTAHLAEELQPNWRYVALPLLTPYIVRQNCEYSVRIVAENEEEAIAQCRQTPNENWDHAAWSEITADVEDEDA